MTNHYQVVNRYVQMYKNIHISNSPTHVDKQEKSMHSRAHPALESKRDHIILFLGIVFFENVCMYNYLRRMTIARAPYLLTSVRGKRTRIHTRGESVYGVQ